jgi:hypothetical protein
MPRKVNKSYIKVFNDEILAEEQFYRGDKGLPTADSKYEWTPDMILALQRCQTDIKYFAENFFTIVDLSDGGKRKHIPLRKYQTKFLESMMNEKRLLLLTCRQSGKCLSVDTQVVMKFKPINLKVKMKVGTYFKLMKIKNKFERFIKKIVSYVWKK